MRREHVKAAAIGALATGALAALIVLGSRNLAHIDAALVGYTFACLFATFAIAYRYSMWLQRPPTRVVLAARLAALLRPGYLGRTSTTWPAALVGGFALNEHIWRRRAMRGRGPLAHHVGLHAGRRRSPSRWSSAGCTSRRVPGDLSRYRAFVFGFPLFDVPHESVVGLPDLPRAGLVVAARHPRGDDGDAASDATTTAAAALQDFQRGHPAAVPPVRGQRHRADADGRATPG